MHATESPGPPTGQSRAWPWMSLAVVAALVFAYVLVVRSPGRSNSGTEGPAIGRHLIQLRLEPLTGTSSAVSLDDLFGHVTLLNFWGTWCGPCIQELPHIVKLAGEFGDQQDFRLYAVSCEGTDNDLDPLRAATQAFLDANQVSLPTYADQAGASRHSVAMVLGADNFPGYPTNIVFDRQGVIRGFWLGYDPAAIGQMQSLVRRLLEEPAAP